MEVVTKKKTIGIIGGMGPMATVDMFRKIVALTDAKMDSEHIHIVIDNNPGIPDRTNALLNAGESPVPMIRQGAINLIQMGAEILLLPCSTSHAFFDSIVRDLPVPVINMIEMVAVHLHKQGIQKACILATNGTVRVGVYSNVLTKYGIESVLLDEQDQKNVMDLIYSGVKKGNAKFDTIPIQDTLYKIQATTGVKHFVLGCTELPLAVKMYGIEGCFIDPTVVVAKAAIEIAGYTTRNNLE